nr:MAG TPA: ComZ [Caudoviricetes sp.]
MKYPIDAAAFLEAAEKESGKPLDPASRKLWEYIVDAQNEAYEAGKRDGFMERFKGTDEVAPPFLIPLTMSWWLRSRSSVRRWTRPLTRSALTPSWKVLALRPVRCPGAIASMQ